MPDYNLGRAHGEIVIDADTRGIQEAKAEMAATSAEAAALDKSMGRVNETFDKNRQSSILSAEQLVRERGRVEELRIAYERYNRDYQDAARKREDIQRRLGRATQDEETSGQRLLRLGRDLQRAKDIEERTLLRMETAYERYQTRLSLVRYEVEKFNQAHLNATRGLQNIRNEAERAGQSLEQLADKLSSVTRILSQVALYGLGGAGAGGSLGLLGGAGIQGLTTALGGAVEIVKDFAGAMLLVPGVVNGAVLSLGTLAVAFHGVQEAMGSLEDPAKFAQSLHELAPAAQQVMIQLQGFIYAFRGARLEIQQSLFAPIIDDIRPLVYTWLPELMHAGQRIATEFGQAFHQVFQFFQQPAVIQGFQLFVNNLVRGFQAARNAIEPFLSAWNTLATVGSQVFDRLGTAIATIAQEFNSWVQNAASSGKLLEIINSALNAFTQLGHIVRDLSIGLINMFNTAEKVGGNFIQIIANIAAEFRAWTESTQGQAALTEFFTLVHDTAQAALPILRDFGHGIMIIVDTLMRLGIAAAPGLTSFFDSLVQSLQILAPALVQSAPAISDFFKAFGETLVQVVQQLGPELPNLFRSMAGALVDLMKVLPPVASALAKLLEHVTPKEIELLILFVIALKGLIGIGALAESLTALANPLTWIIIGIGLLVTGIILLVQNWGAVEKAVGSVTDKFGGLSGIIDGLKRAWDKLTDTVSHWWDTLTNAVGGAWDSIVNGIKGLADKIIDWWDKIDFAQMGKNFVQKIINGIVSMKDAVVQAGKDYIFDPLRKLFPSSRAEDGPFAQQSPEELGAKVSTDYAAGIESGTPAVTAASTQVASGAYGGLSGAGGTGGGGGLGPGGFTSAGIAGISGKGLVGGSGFDQWIDFITKDLSAWSKIGQDGFKLFRDISKTITDSIEIIASMWNNGRNPLTQAGGIAGPPIGAQQGVPGVPNAPIYGPPPRPELAGPLPGQQTFPGQEKVPGVPNVPPGGNLPVRGPDGKTYYPPGFTGPIPPGAERGLPPAATPPAPPAPPASPAPSPFAGQAGTSGQPPAPTPPAPPPLPPPPTQVPAGQQGIPAGPSAVPNAQAAANVGNITGDTSTPQGMANAIAAEGRRRGWTNDQITAAINIAQDESGLRALGFNTSGGNASVGGVGGVYQQSSQAGWGTAEQILDPRYGISKFADIFGENLRRFPNISALNAAILTQNPQLVTQYGIRPEDLTTGSQYGRQVTAAVAQAPGIAPAAIAAAPPAAPGGAPAAAPPGGAVSLNLGDKVTVQTNSIDCGPASARIVLQGDAQFGGKGAKDVEDMFSNIAGVGQGPQAYRDLLNRFAPQANYQFTPSAGSTPQAMMDAIQRSVNAGFAPILNYNAPGPIQGAVGGPIGQFEQGGQIEHFVVVQGYDPTTNRVIIRDPGVTDPNTGQASVYSITTEEALRLSQNQGLIAAQPAPGVRGQTPFLPGAAPAVPASTTGQAGPEVPQIPATPAAQPTLGGAALGAGLIGAGIIGGGLLAYGTTHPIKAAKLPFKAVTGTYRGIRSIIDKLRGGIATEEQLKAYQTELAANGGDEDAAINKVFNITPDEAEAAKTEAPEIYEQIRTNAKATLSAGARLTPQQEAWINEVNLRPKPEGAEVGNVSEVEWQYLGRLLKGKAGTEAPPPPPPQLRTAAGEWAPYEDVMAQVRPPAQPIPRAPSPVLPQTNLPGPGALPAGPGEAPTVNIRIPPGPPPRPPGGPPPGAAPVGGAPIPPESAVDAFGRALSIGGRVLSVGGPILDIAALSLMIYGDAKQQNQYHQLLSQGVPHDQAYQTVFGSPFPTSSEGIFRIFNGDNLGGSPSPQMIRDAFGGRTPTKQEVSQAFGGRVPKLVDDTFKNDPAWDPTLNQVLTGGLPVAPAPARPAAPTTRPPGVGAGIAAQQQPAQQVAQPPINLIPGGGYVPATTGATGPVKVGGITYYPRNFVGPIPPGGVRGDAPSALPPDPRGVPVQVTNPKDFPGGPNAPAPSQPKPSGQPANPPTQTQGDTHLGTGQPPGPGFDRYGTGGVSGVFPGLGSTDSPLKQFETAASGIASVVGDAFKLFDDIINNIKATADIAENLAIGLHNTEGIVKIIQDVQTYIQTAADIAKTVGDTAGAINSLIPSGGDPFSGGAKTALGAVTALAGVIQGALEATNEAISLGIEVYHEVGKYAGFIIGGVLGGALGTLGGNVRMLLNTRTGEIYSYSEDNPLNKNVIKTPFTNAYNQPPAIQQQNNQLNLYTGPGQSPMQMMQSTMWMVSTGAPQVASVAGAQ